MGEFTIDFLCKEFGVSRRTVYRYVALGLLPRPSGTGPGARYSNVHVNRMRAIRSSLERRESLADLAERYRTGP